MQCHIRNMSIIVHKERHFAVVDFLPAAEACGLFFFRKFPEFVVPDMHWRFFVFEMGHCLILSGKCCFRCLFYHAFCELKSYFSFMRDFCSFVPSLQLLLRYACHFPSGSRNSGQAFPDTIGRGLLFLVRCHMGRSVRYRPRL